ncbi:MAG TPA: FAD-binding protein, partial [Acidimicrobiales bacterium]|nr:FAD-binding protein [Acidimicrobiales bacterium]
LVSRAIQTEILEGRGVGEARDAVHLDLTHLDPAQIDAKLPDVSDFVRTYLGIEPKTAPIPIQPTAHYAMGGIPTNTTGEVVVDADGTVLPGLYAAGECACVSVHGANRLGTNSLLDIVVFGKRGGRAMVEFARQVDLPELPDTVEEDVRTAIERMKSGAGDEKVAWVRADLQAEMTNQAFVYRSEDSLASALDEISALRERYHRVSIDDKGPTFNYDLTEALELGYLLDLAEAVVASAWARTESRGAHFRTDHPVRDDANWMKHTLAYRQDDGSIRLDYKDVEGDKYIPMERKY